MRHANPLSVWTGHSVLPFQVMSFRSRIWIGWWCLVPGTLSVLWMFFNPVLFGKPKSTKNWASKAVLGERVFLNTDRIEIPEVHRTLLFGVLNGISGVGIAIAIWSVVFFRSGARFSSVPGVVLPETPKAATVRVAERFRSWMRICRCSAVPKGR